MPTRRTSAFQLYLPLLSHKKGSLWNLMLQQKNNDQEGIFTCVCTIGKYHATTALLGFHIVEIIILTPLLW